MDLKGMRYLFYQALYFPLLLLASTSYIVEDSSFVVQELSPRVVAPKQVIYGQDFEAKAFLAVGGEQGQQLTGESNEAPGALEAVGDSMLALKTDGLLQRGESETRVSYAGHFGFDQVGGGRSELPIQGSVLVKRPEVLVKSETAQALYRNTLNNLRFDVPGLENRPLKLAVKGGEPREGRTIGVSPSGNSLTVEVFLPGESEDVYLGERSFQTIAPPKPEIEVRGPGGKALSQGDPLPLRRAMLTIDVKADEQFKQSYPRDAQYTAASAEVYLRRGQRASSTLGKVSLDGNGRLVLTRKLSSASRGDQLIVRLTGLYRKTHSGRSVPVDLSEGQRTYSFTLQ